MTADFDRAIASRLDEVLRDAALWEELESPPDDPEWRDQMAARSLELFELTMPAFDDMSEQAKPVHFAAGVLREVADGCAIVSIQPPDARLRSFVPVRTVSGDLGLEEWAASLGVNLSLRSAAAEQQADLENETSDIDPAEIAARWAAAMRILRMTLDRRARDPQLELGEWPQIRDMGVTLIAYGRLCVLWASRWHGEDAGAIAVSLRLAGEAVFSAAQTADPDVAVFPPDDVVARFLEVSGGGKWLLANGIDIPPWLSTAESGE